MKTIRLWPSLTRWLVISRAAPRSSMADRGERRRRADRAGCEPSYALRRAADPSFVGVGERRAAGDAVGRSPTSISAAAASASPRLCLWTMTGALNRAAAVRAQPDQIFAEYALARDAEDPPMLEIAPPARCARRRIGAVVEAPGSTAASRMRRGPGRTPFSPLITSRQTVIRTLGRVPPAWRRTS